MDAKQIHAEPAGPTLDAWVAEHVMGLRLVLTDVIRPDGSPAQALMVDDGWPQARRRSPPRYSTDMGAAWDVVSHLWGDSWSSAPRPRDEHDFILDGFCGTLSATFSVGSKNYRASAESMPLAICRAALLAVIAPRITSCNQRT